MSRHPGQFSFVLLAVLASGGAGIVCFYLVALLGVVTGVIAMCPGGPEWWSPIYLLLFLLAPPVSALWVGVRVYRKLNRPYR
jgi:hypothetical protein